MKYKNLRIMAIQAVLVLMMSAAVSYSLLFIGNTAFFVFVGLVLIGGVMIFFQKVGPAPFSLLSIVASLPALLSHNVLDMGAFEYRGLGQRAIPVYENLNLESSFLVALGIGLFIITGYLALSYLHSLQKDYRNMTTGEAEINEVEEVTNRNLSFIGVALTLGVVVAAVVVVILRLIQPAVADYLKDYPWSIMVLGLASVLLLAAFLYWIGTSRYKRPV